MIVVLTALFAVPLMVNWDDYRRDFEVRLSDSLGARVELDGSLNVRLLPTPFVSAENLRIGESGIKGKPILEVKELTLWVSIPPLFKGLVEASRVSLDQPKVVLQFDEKGQPTFKSAGGDPLKESGTVNVNEAALSGFKLSPNLISLKAVNINNGSIVIQSLSEGRARTARQLHIPDIDGVLSAITLNGPFYFNGRYKAAGDVHNVRLALGAREESGFALDSHVTFPGDERIVFKGRLLDDGPSWRINGKMNAGLGALRQGIGEAAIGKDTESRGAGELNRQKDQEPLAKSVETDKPLDPDKRPTPEKAPELVETALFEQEVVVTTAVDLKPGELILDNIEIRGGSLAQPQTVKGRAVVDWRRALRLQARMQGQVVDLNSIYGQQTGLIGREGKGQNKVAVRLARPGDVLIALSRALNAQATTFEQIDLEAGFSQLLVGRGDVRDVSLHVKGDEKAMRVERFDARLPGSGRISVEGRIDRIEERSRFNGSLFLRGLQFDQLVRWASPDMKFSDRLGKGKYMLSGRVGLSDEGFVVDEALGDLGNTNFRLHIRRGADAEVGETGGDVTHVNVSAGEVDLEDLLGGALKLDEHEKALQSVLALGQIFEAGPHESGKGTGARNGKSSRTRRSSRTDVKFFIESLKFSDARLRQVELLWQGGEVGGGLKTFSMISDHGGRVTYEKGQTGSEATSHYIIEANDRPALIDLFSLSGSEVLGGLEKDQPFLDRLLPLRLAVAREVSETSYHHRVDGVLSGSDAAFSILMPRGDETAPITIFGGMENKNGQGLAAMLLPFELHAETGLSAKPDDDASRPEGAVRAALTIMAKGTLKDGFQGQLSLNQPGLELSYDGVVGLDQRRFASDGVLRISSKRTRDALGLFGMSGIPLSASETGPLKGEMTFVSTEGGYAISDLKAVFGETELQGTGLMEVKEAVENLRVAVSTSRLALGTLLAPLEAGARPLETGHPWSSRKFRLPDNGGFDPLATKRLGSFSLALNELAITDQLSLADVKVLWQSDGSRIDITRLEGRALGGQIIARGVLRPVEGGMSLNGAVELKGGQLEEVGGRSEVSLGAGVFDLNLSLSGAGESVDGLIANLVGQGSIALRDGKLHQVAPARLRRLALSYLKEGGETDKLVREIEGAIDKASLITVGSIDLGLELVDGVIRLRQPDMGVRPGVLGLEAELNLEDLSWKGRWAIEAKGAGQLASLPPVYRRMSGGFDLSSDVVGLLEADEFTRFLDLKYKEKELQNLEKARREREAQLAREAKKLAEEEAKRRAAEEARQKAEAARKRAEEERLKAQDNDSSLDWSELPSLVP